MHAGANICFDTAAGGSVTATATSDSSATSSVSAAPCAVAQPGTGLSTTMSEELANINSVAGHQTLTAGASRTAELSPALSRIPAPRRSTATSP